MEPNRKTNTNPKDLSDLPEQREILQALLKDFEPDTQPKRKVVYDDQLRISQIFQIGPQGSQQQPGRSQSNASHSFKDSVKEFFTGCASSCSSEKKRHLTIKDILFNTLKGQEYDWLDRHYRNYTHEELGQLKSKYIEKMQSALSEVRFKVENHKVDKNTRESAMKCIRQLMEIYDKATTDKNYFSFAFRLKLKSENDCLFILMISAYNVFCKDYTPYKRSVLKKLFQKLEASSFSNSIEVLRFLENKDPIMDKVSLVTQEDLNAHVIRNVEIYKVVEKYHEEEDIGLVKVSESSKRRRVVNLLISGFLSEDVDKKEQWNQLLACMPDSEVYGLQWKSDTINRLVKFIALSIPNILIGKNIDDLLTKDNPFIPAFEVARKAGEQLAFVVDKLFPFQFVNIISYSLGSELIMTFVRKTIELNGGHRLNKVVMMGGVSDVKEFENTLKITEHSINILNVRSKHDSVLKHILKLAKPKIVPVGLNPIDPNTGNHLIDDLEVGDKIKGHFAFMSNFGTIANLIKFNEE